ncbi:hypothetical protein [Lentilactobacillus farraginis]|uniref:Uncharacterized protein n=1 Tax=Lentilactobacillus farraginis DSM 18382 = JCM 14108 TaxID=1423743 RepID=A0A0R1VQ69_9LACO|nr:hypothetical protein [Lentilactobacillus farraginis]KRM03820.1 hypothetical protein FD41_GL001067 [Lentilactobacillus farraginis DSM 18382 = JCM 14108]
MTKRFSFKKEQASHTTKIRIPSHFTPSKLTFNFSFLTHDKKYNFNNLGFNKNVKSVFLNALLRLSSDDLVAVYGYPKETGLEKIAESEIHFSLSTEFIESNRDKDCLDGFWVFRMNKKGRVIGKIQDKTFYIMCIDTSFSTYEHGG